MECHRIKLFFTGAVQPVKLRRTVLDLSECLINFEFVEKFWMKTILKIYAAFCCADGNNGSKPE